MNRSILIVICDFLLVSLLAFSTVDSGKLVDGTTGNLKADPTVRSPEGAAARPAESGQDLAAVMRLALDEERKGRDQLMGELNRVRATVNQQQTLLEERTRTLSEREKQVQLFQQEAQAKEQQARQLREEQERLQQQFASAQTNIETLSQRLQTTANDALVSKERVAAMQTNLQQQLQQAANLKSQMDQLARSNQVVLTEKQQIATQLQVAEAEKRMASEQTARMREEVQVERAEKTRLAEGVKLLATKSGELASEIREGRPMAPNLIFSDFLTNRVKAHFEAFHSGFLGLDTDRHRDTETIVFADGTNSFALCHVHDTPVALGDPGTEWESLTGTLSRGATAVPIRSLSFSQLDPRIVLMPVTAEEAARLGCKIYRLCGDPYKFQDAVLVGAREGYYGECRFQIELSTPAYVRLDRNFIKGIFGKFNPSRGDLVFSKQGDLLGVMANGTYCLMLSSFDTAATFQFGQDVRAQHTGTTLAQLYSRVLQMPFRLR